MGEVPLYSPSGEGVMYDPKQVLGSYVCPTAGLSWTRLTSLPGQWLSCQANGSNVPNPQCRSVFATRQLRDTGVPDSEETAPPPLDHHGALGIGLL